MAPRPGQTGRGPLRERVWQQVAGHPAGAVTALVHAGCALLLVRDRSAAWPSLAALPDERLTEVLPVALEETLTERLGPGRAVLTPAPGALAVSLPLLRGAAELAADTGARQAFEFLLGRHLDANPRQYTLTPPGPAALMAALAAPAPAGEGAAPPTVLDPACGTGGLLGAVERPGAVRGQDADPDLAALTALRLALAADADIRVRSGDSLRADAFPTLAADAVLCHPPFNERNWGHDELAYDPRWEYGFPARTESELAWVQHALARLRPGGTAVLLMPPAAASRRSGRRIRADLLRRAPCARSSPSRPAPRPRTASRSTSGAAQARPGRPPRRRTPPRGHRVRAHRAGQGGPRPARLAGRPHRRPGRLDAVRPGRDLAGTPGASRSVPVIELLDDDVDLAPARHLPPPAAAGARPSSPGCASA